MGHDGEGVHRVQPLQRGWGLPLLGKTGFGVLPFGCIFTPKGERAAGSPRTLQPAFFPSREIRISQPQIPDISPPLSHPNRGHRASRARRGAPPSAPRPKTTAPPRPPRFVPGPRGAPGAARAPHSRPKMAAGAPRPAALTRGQARTAPGSPRPPGPAPGRAGRGGEGAASAPLGNLRLRSARGGPRGRWRACAAALRSGGLRSEVGREVGGRERGAR